MDIVRPLPSSYFPTGEPPYLPNTWNNSGARVTATHNCYSYMLNDLHDVPRIHGKPQPGAWKSSHKIQNLINSNKRLSCPQVLNGVKSDNPKIKIIPLQKGLKYKCRPGFYKGFMMVSPGRDYHFARQDNKMIKIYRIIDKKYKDVFFSLAKNNQIEFILKLVEKHLPKIYDFATKIYSKKFQDKKHILRAVLKTAHTWSHKPGGTNAVDTDADKKLIFNPLKSNWNYSESGGINYSEMCCFFEIPSNFTAQTFSTGYNPLSKEKDNPNSLRQDLSKTATDQFYQQHILSLMK